MTAPDVRRIFTMREGRFDRLAPRIRGRVVTTTSTSIKPNRNGPRTMNCRAMLVDGSSNCGDEGEKNAAVLGFSARNDTFAKCPTDSGRLNSDRVQRCLLAAMS